MKFIKRWFSYLCVALSESHMLTVAPHRNGISVSGPALVGAALVIVRTEGFDALERQLARHDPDKHFPFKQGDAWAFVDARYFLLLSSRLRAAIASYRSLPSVRSGA